MKKNIFLACIIGLSLFACKSKTTETSGTEGSVKTDLIVNPDALVQMDVNVDGMTCTGCENTINTGVSEVPGVVEVKSSFQEGKTHVKFDSTQTSIEKIAEIINSKGYIVKGYTLHENGTGEESMEEGKE